MPPTDLTPSQALDVLDSEEAVPDTEMSFPGHVITSECDNDDNLVGNDTVSSEGKLSSPRESFRHGDDDDDITQIYKIQTQPQPPVPNSIIKTMEDNMSKLRNSIEVFQLYEEAGGDKMQRKQLIERITTHFGENLVILSASGLANILVFKSKAPKLF